jgi:hypothetical protein
MLKWAWLTASLLLATGSASAQRMLEKSDCLNSRLFSFTEKGAPDHNLSVKVMAWADGAIQVPVISQSSGDATADQRAVALLARCRFAKIDAPAMTTPDEMELQLAFDSSGAGEANMRKLYEYVSDRRKNLKEYRSYLITASSRSEADVWLKQLQEGAEFEDLARKHLKGESARYGGAMGWVTVSSVEPALGRVLYQTRKAGLHPEPIRLRNNWGLLLVDDIRAAQMLPFEDIRQRLHDYLIMNDGLEESIGRGPTTPAKE